MSPTINSKFPRLILAPLMGVTGATFRRIYNRHFPGFSCALAPFITTTHGNPAARSHFKDILPINNTESLPLIPQLIGRDGPDFVAAANRLHGEFGFAEVNWNIGCPSGTVTAKRRGAGILPYPDQIESFLDHVCTNIKSNLSIKMRLGMHDPYEFRPLAPILNRYPIHEITIHPRTGDQMYEGSVNLDAFTEFSGALDKPVVYNGDITTTAYARELLHRFPKLTGLMIGRGAIANPFLPLAIRENGDERSLFDLKALAAFHDDLLAAYHAEMQGGPLPLLARMKELWAYWFPALGTPKTAKKILKAKTLVDYHTAVAVVFTEGTIASDLNLRGNLR
jgi:tRNA-dihydrouridine synthase B